MPRGKPTKKYAPSSRKKRSGRTQRPVRIGKGELRRRARTVAMAQEMATQRVVLEAILDRLQMTVMHDMAKFITNEEE